MIKTNTLQITQDILALVSEIDEFKGAWRALGTLAPDRLSARAVARGTHSADHARHETQRPKCSPQPFGCTFWALPKGVRQWPRRHLKMVDCARMTDLTGTAPAPKS
jgi:hypothetical protein